MTKALSNFFLSGVGASMGFAFYMSMSTRIASPLLAAALGIGMLTFGVVYGAVASAMFHRKAVSLLLSLVTSILTTMIVGAVITALLGGAIVLSAIVSFPLFTAATVTLLIACLCFSGYMTLRN